MAKLKFLAILLTALILLKLLENAIGGDWLKWR